MIIFYDGDCEFCKNRMRKILSRDVEKKLTFEDINDPGLILELYGLTYDEASAEICAVEMKNSYEVAKIHKGIDSVIAIYEKLGYSRAFWMKLPIFYTIMKICYKILNRIRMSL